MKIMNIKHKTIIMSLLAMLLITSCDKENGRTIWTGSYVEFDEATSSGAYLRVNDGLNVADELQINLVAAPSSSAITVNVEVDAESTTAIAGVHYVDLVAGPIIIPANSSFGSVPFEVIDDNIEPGETWVLAYKITGGSADIGPATTSTHSIIVTCEMSPAQMVGDWKLDMQDSWGDGWNGASVDFEVDGVKTSYDLDSYTSDGLTGTVTITVPSGTTSLKFFFNSGEYDGEVTFQITAPNGVKVGDYGPGPAEGELEVDACLL
jgi:hypothetical protein